MQAPDQQENRWVPGIDAQQHPQEQVENDARDQVLIDPDPSIDTILKFSFFHVLFGDVLRYFYIHYIIYQNPHMGTTIYKVYEVYGNNKRAYALKVQNLQKLNFAQNMSLIYLESRLGTFAGLQIAVPVTEIGEIREKVEAAGLRTLERIPVGIMDYCSNRDLEFFLKMAHQKSEFPMETRLLLARKAVSLIRCLNQNRDIAHDDIKARNFLITDDYELKISDFGFSDYKSLLGKIKAIGTPMYMPPEELDSGFIQSAWHHEAWALAVLLFCIFFGKYPWKEASNKCPNYQMFRRNNTFFWNHFLAHFPVNADIDPELIKKLFNELFEEKPENRSNVFEEELLKNDLSPPDSATLARFIESVFKPQPPFEPAPGGNEPGPAGSQG